MKYRRKRGAGRAVRRDARPRPRPKVIDQIRDEMALAGVTQAEMAAELRCHTSKVTRILNGSLRCTVETACHMAAVVGLKVELVK